MRLPTVCVEYLDNLIAYLSSQDVCPYQLQGIMGLKLEAHLTAYGRFPLRLFEMILDAGSRLLKDPYLGAHAGAHNSKQAWGMVSSLGMSAPSSREAVHAVVDFSRLLIDHGDVEYSVLGEDLACLSWVVPPRQQASRQLVEFFFSSWYRVNKPMLDRCCSKREIHFNHCGPAGSMEIEAIIDAPVHYNSGANCVVFDSHFLDLPSRFPHPAIYRSLIQAARAELANLQLEDRIVKEVLECIVRQLPEGAPKLEEVAAELGLASRTLQRRLNSTETNFKGLVDHARKQRSKALIDTSKMGLLDISIELGFSDQSAFQKAFKRWFGLAPGRYRMGQQIIQ